MWFKIPVKMYRIYQGVPEDPEDFDEYLNSADPCYLNKTQAEETLIYLKFKHPELKPEIYEQYPTVEGLFDLILMFLVPLLLPWCFFFALCENIQIRTTNFWSKRSELDGKQED